MAVVTTRSTRSHQRRRGHADQQLAEDRRRPAARISRHHRSCVRRLDRFRLSPGSGQVWCPVFPDHAVLRCDHHCCAGDVGVMTWPPSIVAPLSMPISSPSAQSLATALVNTDVTHEADAADAECRLQFG